MKTTQPRCEEDGRFLSFNNNTGGELLLLLHDPVSVSWFSISPAVRSIPFSHLSLSSNRLMNPDRIEADNDRPRPSVNGCLCRVYSCCCCCCGRNNRRNSKAARLTEWQRRELITVRDRFIHTWKIKSENKDNTFSRFVSLFIVFFGWVVQCGCRFGSSNIITCNGTTK